MPLSGMDIQEKARSLYGDLTKYTNHLVAFAASHRWFERFKSRHAFHNLKLTREAAAAYHSATAQFPAVFKSVIADGGYTPSQVFNLDETGLHWKRLSSHTFISINSGLRQ